MRKRRTKPIPRRHATTRTSQQIIDAIIVAATELLADHGLDGMTTNHIAARAGVSIGSLYHYFPSKEAIVAEINVRLRRAAADELIAALDGFDHDFAGRLRAGLRTFVDLRGRRRDVRTVLMRDVPIAWVHKGSAAVWSSVVGAATATLRRIRPGLDEREARLRVFTALHAIQGVTMGMVLWPIEDASADDVIASLEKLVTSVLLV